MTPDALTQHLSLFLDVLESGSFSAAARRHPLTPSAVARRIDTLEAAVGSRLFVRSTHAVRATPAGNAFAERARRIVEAFVNPVLAMRASSEGEYYAQLVARDEQLAERKRIELAKGLLMKMKSCNEEEAYTLMRRQAMSRQQKLVQVAEQIIAMHDMLGN